MKITLEALEVLDAIDVRGSFSAAAEALHRVPSSITHAVARLEDDLGFALFRREGRRAVLTEAGRTLLEEGRLLLRDADELEARVKRVASGWERELRIALQSLLDFSALLPLIDAFDRLNSGTRLRFNWEVLGGGWDALLHGRADLAVGVPGDAPGPGFVMRPFGRIELTFAVAPDHPLAHHPTPLTQADIARYRAIAIADTSRGLAARTVGIQRGQEVLTVPDMKSKCAAQIAGLGVGRLLPGDAAREVAAGRLVTPTVADAPPAEPIYLAWRSQHQGKALEWWTHQLLQLEWVESLTRLLRE